jgi:hypothetical protein
VLINGVGINERLALGVGEQALGVLADDFLRQAVALELAQAAGGGGAPLFEMRLSPAMKAANCGWPWMVVLSWAASTRRS